MSEDPTAEAAFCRHRRGRQKLQQRPTTLHSLRFRRAAISRPTPRDRSRNPSGLFAASHCRQLEGRCRRGRREGITRGGPNPTTDATLNTHFVGLDDRPEPRAGPDDGRTACFRFDGGRWQSSDLIGRRVEVAIIFLGPTVIHGAGNLGWRSDPQTARYRPCWTTITDDRGPGGAIKEGGPGGGSDPSGTFPDSCDRR